jgi:hypothetical protein
VQRACRSGSRGERRQDNGETWQPLAGTGTIELTVERQTTTLLS